MPTESSFHRRLYAFLAAAFRQRGLRVSGACRLLTESEMLFWIKENKPCAIFEMNRVKDDIPFLHDFNIPHITWIVDFKGRTENQVKGSDITYFFDPGWDENFDVGGFQDWLPPGTCTDTFFPSKGVGYFDSEFNFIGHIPKPWSSEELDRRIGSNFNVTFKMLLSEYEEHLNNTKFEFKTHNDLGEIIKNICRRAGVDESSIDSKVYYDLMERTKRVENRVGLMDLILKKSKSVVIYGSENWKDWPSYRKYYKHYVESMNEMNEIHQMSKANLHDGLSFHFRAIDCMASGGVVFWYDNNVLKFNRGLQDFFEVDRHYYVFDDDSIESVCESFNSNLVDQNKAKLEIIEIIKSRHTWVHRVDKILADIDAL